ncbi:MAG TPA: SPFH domain-containing protein [Caldimonas sp.]|jgi:regulator of protease activity HflC (stomatin/prohibitin superfamily)
MWQERLKSWFETLRARFARKRPEPSPREDGGLDSDYETIVVGDRRPIDLRRSALPVLIVVIAVASTAALVLRPPLQAVGRGEVGVRTNHLTGSISEWGEGSVFVLPGLQQMRVFALHDQTWRATRMTSAEGPAPLQSVEGLSLGADLTVRYAIDRLKVAALVKSLPDNVADEIVEPAAEGVVYKVFARYTVREIFSTKRAEIQAAIEAELKPRLAVDGIVLRNVQIGKIDLPPDYRRGMERLLAEELAGEKMKYTLDLKEKQVRETELSAQAEKVRREIGAEAAAREQVIAAKAQEEAMKHVLPFKQRQIEQRQLEAEAEKVSRIKAAEAAAQARRIEASGEAEARQKLADAEVYRLDKVGKSNAEQMGREGALLSRHPLLIQKTMADKLSDKVQVIIAAPGTDGSFIGAGLLGSQRQRALASASGDAEQRADAADAKETP